jgi:hypothetical protein
MPRWNHAYTLAFQLETDKEDSCDVSDRELISAILLRLYNLVSGDETVNAPSQHTELNEAVCPAFDSYEVETPNISSIESVAKRDPDVESLISCLKEIRATGDKTSARIADYGLNNYSRSDKP